MFQLVLQLKPWGERDFDQLVALEDLLIDELDGIADVGGHDMGADEANIFIRTSEPAGILPRCVAVAETAGLLPILSAAYRPVHGERYTRLWPSHDVSPFEIK